MKKVFLALTVIGLVTLTSCKSEEKKVEDTVDTTEGTMENAAETANPIESTETTALEAPTFSNPDVQKFANEYAAYSNEVLNAVKNKDVAKVAELQKQAVEWAQKAQTYTQKMSEEDAKMWDNWTKKIAEAVQSQAQ